jgi:PTS system nitrogen regulatory IIA component
MRLMKFIAQSCIEPELKAANKASALRALTRLLFGKRQLQGEAAALSQIMGREAIESTGIGRGIAVPHARVAGLEELVCAVGRVSRGLDFNAVDKQPVFLIFLICYPPAQQTAYLNFIASVAKLLRGDDLMKAILNAGSAEEIFSSLEEYSEALVRPEERLARDSAVASPEGQPAEGLSSDLLLLARLELCAEMLESADSGLEQIQKRIENISSLLDPEILEHYRRLKKGRGPALAAVEGRICRGCFMQLPTELAQRLYGDRGHVYRCPNCNRFIYAL